MKKGPEGNKDVEIKGQPEAVQDGAGRGPLGSNVETENGTSRFKSLGKESREREQQV